MGTTTPYIIVDNIMKVADIDSNQLSDEAIKFFTSDVVVAWRDVALGEHIFNMEDINQEDPIITHTLLSELQLIDVAVRAADCSYFRIIYQ